jgi:hypothetical protein
MQGKTVTAHAETTLYDCCVPNVGLPTNVGKPLIDSPTGLRYTVSGPEPTGLSTQHQ